jgi:hypothetical protein
MPTDAAFFTVELILMTVGAEALLGQECFTCGTRKGNVPNIWGMQMERAEVMEER